MKIYKHISCAHDALLLQSDLDLFYIWCQNNFLELNINKCQVMTFSRKRPPLSKRSYTINCEPIPFVNSICDLGLLCDPHLNFHSHIDSIVNKANSTLGFVKRWSKEFCDPYVTKSLYTTFVRPLLEYSSQVWSPYYQVHIQRIEAVQRRFIRYALRGLEWDDPL